MRQKNLLVPSNTVAKEVTNPAWELVSVSHNVSYFRNPNGDSCVYIGGNNKQKLRGWGDWLTRTHAVSPLYRNGEKMVDKAKSII